MGCSCKGAGLAVGIKWFLCTTAFSLWEFTLTLTLFQFWVPPDYQLLFAYTSFKFTLSKALFLVQTTGSVVNQRDLFLITSCWRLSVGRETTKVTTDSIQLFIFFQHIHVLFVKNNLGLIVVLQPTIPKTIYEWSGHLIHKIMVEKARATKTKWLDQRKREMFQELPRLKNSE